MYHIPAKIFVWFVVKKWVVGISSHQGLPLFSHGDTEVAASPTGHTKSSVDPPWHTRISPEQSHPSRQHPLKKISVFSVLSVDKKWVVGRQSAPSFFVVFSSKKICNVPKA
jgi:hypothetical protein